MSAKEKKLQQEIWECRACDSAAPCRIEITYSDDKLPKHLKGNQRFRRQVCLCKETPTPLWDRIDTPPAEAPAEVAPESNGYASIAEHQAFEAPAEGEVERLAAALRASEARCAALEKENAAVKILCKTACNGAGAVVDCQHDAHEKAK